MLLITALVAAGALHLLLYKAGHIVRLYRAVLPLLTSLTLAAEMSGANLNPALLMLAYLFVLTYLGLQTLAAS